MNLHQLLNNNLWVWCNQIWCKVANTETSDSCSAQITTCSCSALLTNKLHLLQTKVNGKLFPSNLYQTVPLPSNLCSNILISSHCLREELNGMQILSEIGNNSGLCNNQTVPSVSKDSTANISASMRVLSFVIEMDQEPGNNSNSDETKIISK